MPICRTGCDPLEGALSDPLGLVSPARDQEHMQSPHHLLQQAEKARRLAKGVHDPELIKTLLDYAAECEALAAEQKTIVPPRSREA